LEDCEFQASVGYIVRWEERNSKDGREGGREGGKEEEGKREQSAARESGLSLRAGGMFIGEGASGTRSIYRK
jgi:hypothetical protein